MEVQRYDSFWCVKPIKDDLERMGIKDDDCLDRVSFRKKFMILTFYKQTKIKAKRRKGNKMKKVDENKEKERLGDL